MPDDRRRPLLPVTSSHVQEALEQIMRDVGFSDALIRTRFPTPPDGTTYPPDAIRVLEGMTPLRRPAGHVVAASEVQES